MPTCTFHIWVYNKPLSSYFFCDHMSQFGWLNAYLSSVFLYQLLLLKSAMSPPTVAFTIVRVWQHSWCWHSYHYYNYQLFAIIFTTRWFITRPGCGATIVFCWRMWGILLIYQQIFYRQLLLLCSFCTLPTLWSKMQRSSMTSTQSITRQCVDSLVAPELPETYDDRYYTF